MERHGWASHEVGRKYLWVLDAYYADQRKWEPYWWSKLGSRSAHVSPHFLLVYKGKLVAVAAGINNNNGWKDGMLPAITKLLADIDAEGATAQK